MENNTKSKEKEIDLSQIFYALRAKWYVILISGIALAIVAFTYFNFIVTPQYTSDTSILVLNRQNSDSITATDLTSSTTLSKDYVKIVTSRAVLEQVIADMGLDMTEKELADKVSASIETDTRIIVVKVTDPDPILAKQIAETVSQVSINKISELMNIPDLAKQLNEAKVPTEPSSPATKRNTVIAALLGIVIAAAVVVIVTITNDTIKTPEDIEKYLGVSTLGVIPVFENDVAGSKSDKAKPAKNTTAV